MNKYMKITIFGFVVWLIPFVISFLIFPIKDTMKPSILSQ
mgnify:CR=1 FL=1